MTSIPLRSSHYFASGLIWFVTISLVASQASDKLICYDPNGVQSQAIPCNPNVPDGPCCTEGWVCLSNGLCEPGSNVTNYGDTNFYRPDCTNPYWNTSACFSGCNTFPGNGLQACGSGEYCCYNYDGCDCASTSLFDLGIATVETTVTAPSSTTSTVAISSSITSATPSTHTQAATAAAGSTTASATSTPAASPKSNNAVPIGVGVGVGVGVGFVLLGGLIYYCTRHRSRTLRQQIPTDPYANNLNAEMDSGVSETKQLQQRSSGVRGNNNELYEMPEQNYRSAFGFGHARTAPVEKGTDVPLIR